MACRLDAVDAAAGAPTRLARESRSCRDGVVPTGEKIGLYFVFLGHYTEQAGVAAIIGVIVWLAACLTGGVNSPVIPFFCVVMSVWATVFLETWKRKQSRYAMEWGMVGIEEIEEERPDFLESDLVLTRRRH